ncbi:MAG: hypothetical protein JSW72_07030 [Candidatus Bathyarchaeota archaeon]|nr:MAG: hypothetical protein JSW72_07030 [Candidatus Bathyarchaeota archaeon]
MARQRGGFSIVKKLQEEDLELAPEILEDEEAIAPSHRRDRHDIIAEILITAKGGKKKTYIMYKARLSHSQLKLYLELLNRNGMIANNNGVYKTTPKGLTFVQEFQAINFLFRQ